MNSNYRDYVKANNTKSSNSFRWFTRWVEWSKGLHYQSIRDFQYATQMAAAVTFACLVSYISDYRNHVIIGWVVPTLAGLVIADTLGGTLLAARVGLVNFIPTTIFLYILQKIGMGYHNYTSSTILFFLTTFFIGYANPMTISRKIALVLPAILFTTFVTTPRESIPDDFVWVLLGEVLVATAVAIGTSLFVFPRYASTEIHDRFTYNLNKISEVFELSILAMMAKYKAEADVYLTEADHLFTNLIENQGDMNVRLFMSQFEPVYWLRKMVRYYQPIYLQFTLQELVAMSSTFLWHCNSMMHAVKHLHFNEYHADTVETSQKAFLQVAKKLKQVIQLLQEPKYYFFGPSNSGNSDEIDFAIKELTHACDAAYEALSLSLKIAEDHERANKIEKDGTAITPDEFKGVNSSIQGLEEMARNYADFTQTGTLALGKMNPVAESTETENRFLVPPNYDLDAMKGGNRVTFSFFNFHLSELVQAMNNRFHSQSLLAKSSPAPKEDANVVKSSFQLQKYVWEVLLLPWIVYWKGIINVYLTDVENKTKTGLRTAILMGAAIIFVEVPVLTNKFEQGLWIMFAMIFSLGDNFGGTITQMRLRFLGTLFGAIYSYFIYIAITNDGSPSNNDDLNFSKDQTVYYTIGMLIPFILLNGMIKQNKEWSYFGSIAVTTAIIVTLGRVPYANPIFGDYSLLRIQQNSIGIGIVFVLSILLVPVFALDLLKYQLIDVIKLFIASITKLQDVYEKDILTHEIIKNQTNNSQFTGQLQFIDQQYQQFLYKLGFSTAMTTLSPRMRRAFSDVDESDEPIYLESSEGIGGGRNGFNIHNHPLSTKELHELNNVPKLQKINYLLRENMAINYKLSQQNLTVPQASMESIYGIKPFPLPLYLQVIKTETKILQLLISIDRILLRIQSFLSFSTIQNILITFIQQFTIHLKQLFTKMKETLQITIQQLIRSILIPDTSVVEVLQWIGRSLMGRLPTSTTAASINNTEPANSNNNNNNGNDENAENGIGFPSFEQKRLSHANLMKDLNYHSMKIFVLSQQFNHFIFHDWLTEVLIQSGMISSSVNQDHEHTVDGIEKKGSFGKEKIQKNVNEWLTKETFILQERRATLSESDKGSKRHDYDDIETGAAAVDGGSGGQIELKINQAAGKQIEEILPPTSSLIIHRLFDVLTTFNGLFYASSHMGKATIELSNLIFTITELENQVERNPF